MAKAISLPSAKILVWNAAGKAIPYIITPDRAYCKTIFPTAHKMWSDEECSQYAPLFKLHDLQDSGIDPDPKLYDLLDSVQNGNANLLPKGVIKRLQKHRYIDERLQLTYDGALELRVAKLRGQLGRIKGAGPEPDPAA
jgi:hypothetical protein